MSIKVFTLPSYDIVLGTTGDDLIVPGLPGDPLYDALAGPDRVVAGRGDDWVEGDPEGEIADDVIAGNLGDDHLDGGGGDDRLIGGEGADMLIGGDGDDTADYRGSARDLTGASSLYDGVIVNLASGLGRVGDAAGDVLTGIENVVGSRYDDLLTGDDGANRLNGGGGDDRLIGGEGDDLLYGGADDDFIEGGDGNDRLEGGDGADNFYFRLTQYYDVPIGEFDSVYIEFILDVGVDRIVDFDPSADTLTLSYDGGGFQRDFEHVQITEYSAASGSGAHVRFRYGEVYLQGVSPDDLTPENVLFDFS